MSKLSPSNILTRKEHAFSSFYLIHEVHAPTKNTDYDYNPADPSMRYCSSYLHKLVFEDNITHSPIVSLGFSSDTCATLISSIYKILFDTHDGRKENDHLLVSPIYINDDQTPCCVMLLNPMHNIFTIRVCNEYTMMDLMFRTGDETMVLLSLLEDYTMENMFISGEGEM